MKKCFILILLASFTLQSCDRSPLAVDSSLNEEWNRENHPQNMGVSSDLDFRNMPTSARLQGKRLPWSGYYWATFQGGTAYRWQLGGQSSNPAEYRYSIPSRASYENLSSRDASVLSPAEKYDLLTGRTDMPHVVQEFNSTAKAADAFGRVQTWFGLCHGWAPAAYMEPKPTRNVTVKTPFGQELTFYPSDLKALITKYYAESQTTAETIGNRCEARSGPVKIFDWFNWTRNSPDCRDTNPGAFHLAVVDYIGIRGESFVAEVDRDSEVWNHPVVGYEFQYGNARRVVRVLAPVARVAPTAVAIVNVTMNLEYAIETTPGQNLEQPATKTTQLHYQLEIDGNARIVGGKWLSTNHPDFLWRLKSKPSGHSTLNYDLIRSLLDQSAI